MMFPSKYFRRQEFSCRCGCGCGFCVVDAELLAVLDDIRKHFGKAIIITSGARSASQCGYKPGGLEDIDDWWVFAGERHAAHNSFFTLYEQRYTIGLRLGSPCARNTD